MKPLQSHNLFTRRPGLLARLGQRLSDRFSIPKVVVIGAQMPGQLLAQQLEQFELARVVGFFEPNSANGQIILNGIPVVNSYTQLARIIPQKATTAFVIAPQLFTAEVKNKLLDLASQHGIPLLQGPSMIRLQQNQPWGYESISPASIDWVLDSPSPQPIIPADLFAGQTVLITGAAGSIGSGLARLVLDTKAEKVILLDQAETPLAQLEQELKGHPQFEKALCVLADVTQTARMQHLLQKFKPNVILHTAACKHVPVMELNPYEAWHTNVHGTYTLAQAAAQQGVDQFILISTDKAVNPSNVMGASKRIAELAVLSLQNTYPSTKITVTRFGNVLGSNGSVVPIFMQQIAKGGPVTVTTQGMTRFFITIQRACQQVLSACAKQHDGEIVVLNMGKAHSISKVAQTLIQLAGLRPEKDIAISYTGLRPGEKEEEILIAPEDKIIAQLDGYWLLREDSELLGLMPELLEELAKVASTHNDRELVAAMGRLLPSFISTNPVWRS